MKLKEIFKKSIAMELKSRGFRIEDAKVNFEHPKFVVYYFEDTQELQNELKKLMK